MRRGLILFMLLIGMELIEPLGRFTPSSAALLTFGFLILAAYTVGEIGEAIGLPKLVGYLIAGMLFGPSALDVVTTGAISRLSGVADLAIALIAFMAGAELRWEDLRRNGGRYIKILSSEMSFTFLCVAGTVILLQDRIPVIADRALADVVVFALLFATVVAAHSPAATLALLTETRARGPVARTALGVVLVSDVVLILLFTLVATVARMIVPPTGAGHMPSFGLAVWEIAGALLVGAIIGGAVALYLRYTSRDLLLFGIIVAMLGAELARIVHVEMMLTLLMAGFVMENVSAGTSGHRLRTAVERAAAPLFVVFFALAGAAIAVRAVVMLFEIVVPVVLVRAAAIWLGAAVGTRWAGSAPLERRHVWSGLIAQAGVAIGLAAVVANVYPGMGGSIQAMALAVIAINQLLGPIVFRRALDRAGEISAPAGMPQPLEGMAS